jgi:histone H3/H4
MISNKKIKNIAQMHSKKLSKQSLKIIEKKILDYVSELIKKASRKADFAGRVLILPSDYN